METHQQYIQNVAAIALARLPADERSKVQAHITYGAGAPGLRGITYYGVWQNGEPEPVPFVEICAFGEEDDIQLAGTTIHELAHVLAGGMAGHGKGWTKACESLGLRRAKAAGNVYRMAQFDPDIRFKIAALVSPSDGKPVGAHSRVNGLMPLTGIKPKACPLGIGTRGGKSRGRASGSRLRKYVCECARPVIARVASDDFRAHCDQCGSSFKQS